MKAYIICPVRGVTIAERVELDDYVAALEATGVQAHYPPRDVDQTDDGIGMNICSAHRDAMLLADEIHVYWNQASTGSHFDLGMAFALAGQRPIKFKLINKVEATPKKSYNNVLLELVRRTNEHPA